MEMLFEPDAQQTLGGLDSAMRLPLHSDRRENEHISSAKDNDAGKDGDQPFPEHTGLSILQIFSDYVIHYPL